MVPETAACMRAPPSSSCVAAWPMAALTSAGEDAGRGGAGALLVHAPGCPQAQLEEVGAGVDELGDPLAGGQLPFFVLPVDGLGPAALAQHLLLALDVLDQADQFVRHDT